MLIICNINYNMSSGSGSDRSYYSDDYGSARKIHKLEKRLKECEKQIKKYSRRDKKRTKEFNLIIEHIEERCNNTIDKLEELTNMIKYYPGFGVEYKEAKKEFDSIKQ